MPSLSSQYAFARAQGFDDAGNLQWRGERELDAATSENRYDHLLNYYGADDKLAVAHRHIGVSPVGDDSRPGTRGVWEMYRYDALGRRVQTYSVRGSACPSTATECASYFERTVWDGDQLLDEIRTPVSSPTNDLAGGGTYGSYGRVAYLHGSGIDAPLAVTRFDEAGQPAVQTLAPHANWQGDYVDGTTMSGGAVATCTGASGCPRLEWRGGKETADGVATAPGDYPWWGRVVVGQLDGSGLKYQRNRFYDPLTGQFTQADPIGLAGGKNLYVFAGGDPVNYTDPFGLCPMCIGYALFEVGSSIYDAYDLTKTGINYLRGSASKTELAVTAAGAGVGLFSAGGGYGKAARFAVNEAVSNPGLWKKLAFEELLSDARQGIARRSIAGAESRREIDDIGRLTAQYGGGSSDWAKMAGETRTGPGGISQQVHWYENVKTQQRVEFKPNNRY